MSAHSSALSWFWANQSLYFLSNTACLQPLHKLLLNSNLNWVGSWIQTMGCVLMVVSWCARHLNVLDTVPTQVHYPDSEPTSLCTFSVILHAWWRRNKYQFYNLVWLDRDSDLWFIKLEASKLTITAVLLRKYKDWLAQNQDNALEWADIPVS
jgi:hypothetical protein